MEFCDENLLLRTIRHAHWPLLTNYIEPGFANSACHAPSSSSLPSAPNLAISSDRYILVARPECASGLFAFCYWLRAVQQHWIGHCASVEKMVRMVGSMLLRMGEGVVLAAVARWVEAVEAGCMMVGVGKGILECNRKLMN